VFSPFDVFFFSMLCLRQRFFSITVDPVGVFSIHHFVRSAFFLKTFCLSTFYTVDVFYFNVLLVNQRNFEKFNITAK
jgi:hypothetical protein